jgi:NAD(P)-dependent dehydrogenase (short-subunit alcohol dehydrogenase family)
VFTHHLKQVMLDTSKAGPPGNVRIVNITSSGHLSAPNDGINFEDLTLKDATAMARYGQSKLANILHTKYLHEAYGPGSRSACNKDGEIWTSCVHPGLVETNLADGIDQSGFIMTSVISILRMTGMFWSADKGSYNSLFCVASEDMKAEQSGAYLDIFNRFGEPWWESGPAKDAKLEERLERHTKQAMGIKDD